jgi:hypothetical protein
LERDKQIDARLAEELAKIEKNRRDSVTNIGAAAAGIGFMTFFLTSLNQSLDELVGAAFSAFSIFTGKQTVANAGNAQSANMAMVGGGAVAISGVALMIAYSVAPKSFAAKGANQAEVDQAKADRLALRKELDRNFEALARTYAQVFSLSSSVEQILKTKIRAKMMERAKKGEDVVVTDVPQLMVDERLISQDAFTAFRSNLADLEVFEKSGKDLRDLLSQDRYAANVERCKEILRGYLVWLKAAQPDAKGPNAAKVRATIASTERLLLRI